MTSSHARLPLLGGLISLLMLACALLVLASVAAAQAVPVNPTFLVGRAPRDVLDQQQTEATGSETIGGPSSPSPISQAQTFTAGLSGRLDHVQLDLSGTSSDTGGLTVEITTASGGIPDAVLVSSTLPATDISSGGGWVEADFGSGAPVSKGTQYAIVVYAGGSDVYSWGSSSTNPYAGGQDDYSMSSPPSSWSANSSDDTAFKTYVEPTCLAIASTAPGQASPELAMKLGCGRLYRAGGGQPQ